MMRLKNNEQWQTKTIPIGSTTDLEVIINEEGKYGWHFTSIIQTPFGQKIMFERQTDLEALVDPDKDVELDLLKKKFGLS